MPNLLDDQEYMVDIANLPQTLFGKERMSIIFTNEYHIALHLFLCILEISPVQVDLLEQHVQLLGYLSVVIVCDPHIPDAPFKVFMQMGLGKVPVLFRIDALVFLKQVWQQ